ncbi:MAG TPA: Crp/Fnr family transcriptional regulator [Firmicutes bacterium]|nr:Crp/Fnr family transcriptional regulator [Bacillota bacterium]
MFEAFGQALIRSPLFQGIRNEDLSSLVKCLLPKRLDCRRGDYIIMAGDALDSIGVVVTGKAAVIKEKVTGERMVMTILEPGDLFGEMVAFAEEQPRWPATVQAQDDSTVLFIPRERIAGTCGENCPWHQILIRNMLRIVSERALVLNQKVNYLSIKSLRRRICVFLLDHYKKKGQTTLKLPLNRNEMADFLSVARPALSRELGRMREDGLIDYHLSTFRILNIDALQRYAE